MAYADDILLVARNKEALGQMLQDTTDAFAAVGLSIGHAKANWSSHPAAYGDTLNAERHM